MNVDHILDQKGQSFHTVRPDQPVAEAVSAMMEHRIGALLVCEGDDLRGIVTERDILRTVDARPDGLAGLEVREVMNSELVSCAPGDGLDEAMDRMMNNHTGRRVRHLPVLDNGVLAGIISIGDVVQALLTETRFENRLLKNYIKNWPDEPEA